MRRITVVVAVAVLVVGMIGTLPAAGLTQGASLTDEHVGYAAQETDGNETDGNASDIAPGERLSGVLGVQEAEFEGEIERRTFGIRVARAATESAKADVVKEELDSIERRLEQLEHRKEELRRARENGTISEGRFRAEMAQLAARTETVKRLANESGNQARGLPEDVLERKGINVTAIRTLERNAGNLSGPEVAEIARSIAGPGVGAPIGRAGPPGDRGPGGGDAERTIDRAERRVDAARDHVERARERVNGTNASADAVESLEAAEAQLRKAEEALRDAREALDAGDEERAVELARGALDHAAQAERNAREAITDARRGGRGSGQDGDRGGNGDGKQDGGHGKGNGSDDGQGESRN